MKGKFPDLNKEKQKRFLLAFQDEIVPVEFPRGLVVKDPVLSLLRLCLQLWCSFSPWPRNFCMPLAWPKKKEKKKK